MREQYYLAPDCPREEKKSRTDEETVVEEREVVEEEAPLGANVVDLVEEEEAQFWCRR